jgi:hypothetical protein
MIHQELRQLLEKPFKVDDYIEYKSVFGKHIGVIVKVSGNKYDVFPLTVNDKEYVVSFLMDTINSNQILGLAKLDKSKKIVR